jgi:hypothetical protein
MRSANESLSYSCAIKIFADEQAPPNEPELKRAEHEFTHAELLISASVLNYETENWILWWNHIQNFISLFGLFSKKMTRKVTNYKIFGTALVEKPHLIYTNLNNFKERPIIRVGSFKKFLTYVDLSSFRKPDEQYNPLLFDLRASRNTLTYSNNNFMHAKRFRSTTTAASLNRSTYVYFIHIRG